MRADDDVEALRDAHRTASALVDERPDAGVRAAVLAAAARGVDARPRPSEARTSKPPASGPSRTGRWPLSAAALLVVSVLTGLIATRALRDRPEPITTVAASAPTPPIGKAADSAPEAAPASAPAAPVPARNERPRATVDESRRRDAHRAVAPPAPAASAQSAPPIQDAAPARAPAAPPEVRAKADAGASSQDDAGAPAEETAARPAEAGAFRPAPALNAMRTRIGRAAEPATAEAWLERIVKLRADGNDLEADRELDALRRRYPGFEIPAGARRTTGAP